MGVPLLASRQRHDASIDAHHVSHVHCRAPRCIVAAHEPLVAAREVTRGRAPVRE
jgi:hypothetical protein